jgi:ATP-dependent helicase HrpB
VAEVQGAASGARILSAAAIDAVTVETLFADRIQSRRTLIFDSRTGGVDARRERRLGAIRLSSGPDADADPESIAARLIEGVREHGLGLLPWSEAAQALRTRAGYAGETVLDDAALIGRIDEWLPSLVAGRKRLSDVDPAALHQALENLLGWPALQRIEKLAPARFASPAGTTHAIDYAAEGGPRVELRVQALFGLSTHPTLGDGTPLVLSLTSPAGRPIQTTRDLPGFWAGSWAAVAKEMRGRYPRHPWPDDPASAAATVRTKNADARRARSD